MSRSISENSDIIETENKRLIKATSDLKQLGDERVVFKIKDIEEYVIEDKKLLQMYTNISQRNDNKYKEFVEREIVQQKIIEQMNKDNYKQISRAI